MTNQGILNFINIDIGVGNQRYKMGLFSGVLEISSDGDE